MRFSIPICVQEDVRSNKTPQEGLFDDMKQWAVRFSLIDDGDWTLTLWSFVTLILDALSFLFIRQQKKNYVSKPTFNHSESLIYKHEINK